MQRHHKSNSIGVSPLQACAAGLLCPRISFPGEPQRHGNALSMPSGRHDHTCPRTFPYPYGTVEALNQLRDGEPLMTLAMDRLASDYGSRLLAPAGTDTDDTGASRLLHHEWGVILAGGDGTRLQSLTRTLTGADRPKQFCTAGDARRYAHWYYLGSSFNRSSSGYHPWDAGRRVDVYLVAGKVVGWVDVTVGNIGASGGSSGN